MKYWDNEVLGWGYWMGSTGIMKYSDYEVLGWGRGYWDYEVLGWGVLGL